MPEDIFSTVFPTCRKILGDDAWARVIETLEKALDPSLVVDTLVSLSETMDLPDHIPDIARLESAINRTGHDSSHLHQTIETLTVNPALTLVPVSCFNLVEMISEDTTSEIDPAPAPEDTHIIVWHDPGTGKIMYEYAENADLLALKIVTENISPKEAALSGGVSIGTIDSVLYRAVSKGLLLSPQSLVRRDKYKEPSVPKELTEFMSADIFTLQWHITQTCDLRCKHCYDRSDRPPLPYDRALAILDDFYDFCQTMHVRGQVTFTGGNPLLYPAFPRLYQETSDRGFGIAILGNPSPTDQIEALTTIAKPLFFQVSLEGLEPHNDSIRGAGHFQRTLAFLDQLKAQEIFSMVMLTLTRDNMNQVLPLAETLRNRTDLFTFNRLSTVGEGAQLLMADPAEFQSFLKDYEKAAAANPVMGLKDNLFNIHRFGEEKQLFGGCTGHGCGAAFNFLALLPDGEVHACRKFPSPLGNIKKNRLIDIYQSELSQKYRRGSSACSHCELNIVCRGCLAIAYSNGLDIFKEKDPFCFFKPQKEPLDPL